MEEASARLVQEADWINELQENAADVFPCLDVQVLEQGVQQLVENFGCGARACGHADDHDSPDRRLRCLRLRQSALVHHGDFGPGGCQAGIVFGISSKFLAIGSLTLEDCQTGACYA